MKKFMIFLLMAFLYLGTCQARSEASHPNDGKLKLLSWVSPTPSQSFLTRSDAAAPLGVDATVVYSVSIVGAQTACPEQGVTLTAVIDGPVTGGSQPTYVWYLDGTAIPGAAGTGPAFQTYTFTPNVLFDATAMTLPHEFTVHVTIQNCEEAISPVHPFQTVKVAGVVSGPALVCANEDITLTAAIDPANSILPSPATVVAWKWFQGGASYPYATTAENTITLPQSVVSATPGNWEVEPVLESGLTCPAIPRAVWNYSSVTTIAVDATVALNKSADSKTPMCEGGLLSLVPTVTINSTSGVTLGNPTYEWYMNGEHVATTTSASPAYTTTMNTAGVYTFIVKPVYDNYDCSELVSNPFTVTVNAAPALAIVGDNVICAGQTSNLLTATTGFESYTWTAPNGAVATGANQLQGTDPGHYLVTATTSAANGGCTATADFTVYQFGGDLQVSASEYYVCPGEVVALNANLDGWSNENIQYSWTTIPTGVTVQGATNSSVLTVQVNADATGTQQFKVKATANGIANCEIEQTINVNVITPSTANLTVTMNPTTAICEGDQVTGTISGAPTGYTGLYTWYVNGVEVPGENMNVITLNMNEAGTYMFAATLANTVCGTPAPTGNGSVTVNATPEVTISGNDVICQGATATLTAASNISSATYTWAVPTGVTASSTATQTTTVPGMYVVTAKNGNCTATADFNVTQLGGDLQVYASELSACQGSQIMLNANLDGFANQNVTYQWATDNGTLSATNGSTVALTMGSAAAHVTATAVVAGATACNLTSNLVISLLTSPALTSVTVTNPSTDHMCVGDQMNATATGTGVTSVIWYVDGVEVPGQNQLTLAMNLYGEGTHTVAAKPANDVCGAAAVVTAAKHPVVHAVPQVTITGNNAICNTDNAVLTPHIVPTSGSYTVTWSGPDVSHVSSNVLTTNVAGVYTVDVEDNTSHCTASADITVNAFGADLQLTADKTNICSGETVVLNANLNGFNNENIQYTWTGDQLSSIATGSMVTAAPTSNGAHKYVVTASAGDCQMKDSVIVNVTPGTVYATTVTRHNGSEYCEGQQNAYFTASSSPALANALYTWYLDGVEIPGENRNNLFLNGIGIGAHYLAATVVVDGCNSATISSTVNFNVHAAPEVTITGNNVICNGDTAVLTATATTMAIHPATSNSYTYTYAWSNSETTPTIKVTENGTYTVTVTNHITRSGVTYDLCSTIATIEVSTFGGNIQMTVDNNAICLGETVVLNANLNGFNNENIQYAWTGNGLGSIATGSQVNATPTAQGEQKYVVTASAGNCEMKDSVIVNVTKGQTYTTTVALGSYSTQYICQGSDNHFVASSTPAASAYVWYLDGVEIPGENQDSLTLQMGNIGLHTLAAKAVVTGCDTAVVSSNFEFYVTPIPAVTLSGNNVICNGDTAVIVATADTNNIYLWSESYAFAWSDGTSGNTLKTTVPGTYTVTITDVHNNANCHSTASIEVITFGGNLTMTVDKNAICLGETVEFNANLNGFNNENIEYAWTGNGLGSIATGSQVTATPDAAGAQKYIVTASAGNCEMKDSLIVNVSAIDTLVTNLTFNQPSSIQGLTDAEVCQGTQIEVWATTTDSHGSTVSPQYTWYMDGFELPGENMLYLDITMNNPGNHYFFAKPVTEGCVYADFSNELYLDVKPTPVVTLSGDHYYTTDATTATIVAAVSPAGNYSYEWSNGELRNKADHDTLIVGTPGGYGVYTVTVTSAAGCTVVSEPFTVSSVVDLQANIVGATAACQHDIVTLSAVVDYDLEGHTYKWLVNNQYITDAHGISGSTTAHLTFPVDSLYTYYGEVLANEFTVEIYRTGCATPVVSPVHPFLINPVPYVYIAAPEKICKDADLTLEAIVYQLGANAQYQYVWFKNGTAFDTIDYINTITLQHGTFTATDEFAVQVFYQDIACNSDTSAPVTVPFYVEPQAITINMDPTTICTTNQASVWVTDPNTDPVNFGDVTYTWYVNGFVSPLAQSDTLVVDFDHNGAYTFWATASYANYPCAISYTDTLTENVVMHPTVAITGDPIICDNNNINLYALINDTVGTLNYTYEWRLYNSTLVNGANTIATSADINYGNVNFTVTSPDNNPLLQISSVEAQDFPYIFTVVVTTPEGCRVESDPYYVYVGDSVEVFATVDYDSVCAQGMITATAHLGNWNMDNLVAKWQVRTLVTPPSTWSAWTDIDYGTSGILQHVPGVTSQYRIHVTQTTTGCEAWSTPKDVKVFAPYSIHHVVAINHDSNYQTDTVCEGAQLDVVAYLTKLDASGNPIPEIAADGTDSVDANGNPVYQYYIDSTLTYMWELNGMQLQTVHGPSFSAQAYIYDGDPVDYTYTAYIVYDIPGCDLIPVASNTITVRRNPIVTIDGNPNVCYFGSGVENIVLTAWVDGIVDTNATYTWFESGQYRPNPSGYDNNYRESWVPTYENPYIFTVEVTNGDGCTTISDPFIVNVYERPYTNITGDASEICEGGNVTLHANLNNYNDPMLTYQWFKDEVNNQHLLPGATHEVETFEPALGETDYIVKVTHLMDYNTQYCVAYDTFKVNVNAIPVVTAVNDLAGHDTICEGRTVTMTATIDPAHPGVAGGEYYTWYRNGEEILDFHGNVLVDAPVAVDNEPTSYIYSVKVKQSASGCESEVFTFARPVVVLPNPAIELTTDPIVCIATGNNITLTANMVPTVVGSNLTYAWYEDNHILLGFPDPTTENTISFNKPYRDYPYSFSVKTVNDYGCVSEASATVYVNDAPVVNITATETEICKGGEITLTASLDDWNADQLTFQWYDGTTAIAGATSLNYTVVPTQGTHKYTIQIDQLTSLCHATSDTLVVNVNADPTVVLNYAAAQYTVCDGYQVDLTTTVTGGVTGGEVYTWYRNGQVIEGATSATYSEVVSALNGEPTTYNYAVSVAQTAAGCESNVYDQLQTITVNPNPVLVLTTDPIVCNDNGNNITLTANLDPSNVGSNVTYYWMEDNHVLAGFTVPTTNNVITFHKDYRDYPYNFAVQVVNDYACSATAEAQVYVNAAPVVNITVTEDNICVGGEITLTATLNDWNADMLTFQWYDGTTAIAGATELSYTVVPTLGNHDYHVEILQLTSECEATSNHITVTVNPDPVIATVVPSQLNVCYGGQLAITATPEDGYKAGEVYTWYKNGILMEGATAATIYDTPGTVDNNTQTYQYTAVVTRPEAGCTSLPVTSATVTVYPNPVVVITGDQHVCETDSVFLIANVDTTAFPVGTLHYTWYESGQIRDNMAYGLGDNSFYAEYFYARTEPYRFTVTATRLNDATGCIATSNEFLVYVYPQPVVNVTASETQICTNGEVTLTANLNDYNADNIVYQWYEIRYHDVTYVIGYDENDQYVDTTVTVPYRYNIPGATMPTYTTNLTESTTLGVMVLQTNSNCWSNDEIEIIVNPIPVVTAITVSDDTVCDGAQVTVSAAVNPNGTSMEGAVYTWYRNGILIPGATGASFSENVFTTDNHVTVNNYKAVVTLLPSGCVSEISSCTGTVVINPAPTTVSISGNSTICENDSTILTAYSDVEGEWTWSTGSHASSITVPAGTYTVTMKTVEGCEMTSEPFTVEAFGTDLLVSASATSICRGEHTTLYVNQDGWQGNVTYAWDANANNSTATTVDVQPDSTTTYHVTATVNSTNGSCNAEGEVTIIVHQLPAAFTVTPSTTLICEGNQITFTAPVDPQVTGYIWYQNGVEIAGENQNTITVNFNEAGQYTFAAKAISVEGCVSAEASAPVTVTVTPAPSQVTISGVNVLCENQTTTLTAQSDVPGIFVWSTGDTANTITVPAGSYTVTNITAEGCQLTSENFNVTALGTDILVSASATSICRGEHTTLYVDQDGWQGNVTYQWDAQAGNSSASTVDVQPDSTTTYHVTATVYSTNGNCTAEGEVTIIVNQLPAQLVVNATTATTICEGNQVSFHATGDATTTAYIWYQNGVEIPGENQADLTVNYNESGNYNISAKAISNEGCISALASLPVTVTVTDAPSQVTISGVNVLCENQTTTLTAQSDVPGIFVWSTGDTANTITVPAGSYTVTRITTEGCQMTSENFNVTALGTDLLVSASATSICQGEHTTLYVDQDGWQGNVTYAWDAQAGNSTASTVDVQPAATTTYHVTATVHSTNGNCTANGEVTIIVHPLPAQLVVNATTATTICEGNQVSFHATGDATTTAYIWYQNGVEIPGENQADLTVNYNESGNYNISAKAISNEGCISALASLPVTVTVTDAPSQVTISGVNIICENQTTTLTAQSDVPGIFVWSTGDTANTITVPAGSYTVTRITTEGCQMTSENFNVTALGTDILVSASATSICQGEHTTLYVDQEGWQGNVTYAWDAQAGNSTASTVDVQPAATTTYHVTATVHSTNGNCTANGEVTIIVNPLPVVASVTATDTVVCEGTQVTFTATGDANTTAYIWYNNGVEIPGENQANLTVNFNEQGVYNYAVKAISNQNCVSAVAVNAPVVTVNAAPESVTISGNTLICNGGTTTLYANVVPNLPATYAWFKDNVAMNTNTESINVTAAGSYKVVASFNGCSTESDAVVVTVEQAPQLQLTATESSICPSGVTVITAEATGWNNADVNYEWSCATLGNSFSFEGSSYTFTAPYAGTFTFAVTASQATSGCEAVDQITITVNPIPATPVVTVDNATICDGGQVTLTVTNASNLATYTWRRNGVIISDATTATITESPVAVDGDLTTYVYTVVADLPMSGCTSLTSANTIVTVTPTPVVAVAIDGNTMVCEGGSTTLHANVTPAANYNYQWYKDNVLIVGATTDTYVAAELARETAYNYTVVVTANPGCNVTSTPTAITFVADPVVEATISNNISCIGGTATLTAIVDGGVANVNGLNGYTFEWYRNNPNPSDPNNPYSTQEFVGNNATYTTSATDVPGNYTYWVTVTSNYGCQSTSEVVNYSVIADPVVTIAVATGYPTTVCNGGETMLKANVTGGYGTSTYQWYKNGNLLVGETNQTLLLAGLQTAANDSYMVEVTQTGVGCANNASVNLNTLVTVTPTYTVDITGFGNVCEGGTLTLNATVNGVINGDVVTYQWYRVTNGDDAVAIAGANNAQYSTSDLLLGSSYDYYVVVTSSISGCSVVSNSVPANVVAAPTVAIQGANTVCEGGNLTLNAFVSGGVDGAAYTYTWNWTGAANGTTTTNVPTFVPTVTANDLATPYYFTVTITRNDNTGCEATSAAHEVNVLAVPTVSVTADNSYVCENGQVTFTAHVSPVGAYNYVWTINGQQQAVNAATVTTSLGTAGSINASVVVAAANASASCSATATIATPVVVVAAPTVALTATNTAMCVGGVTTLTATVNANPNIPQTFNYEWIVDGGTPVPGITNTLNQTLNTAGVHTYQVRVSQNNNLGCASNWSNVATVQVAEQPVVTLSSEDGLAICEGGSITLTGIVTNYGNTVNGVTNSAIYGNLTFDWTSNGVNVHHNTSNNAMDQVVETLNTVGNYTYQVAVTPTGYNCQPQISNEYMVNVVNNPTWTDVHVYSNNGTDACLGEMVYLMANIEGGAFAGDGFTGGQIQWVVTDVNGNTVNVDGGLGGNSYDTPDMAGTYIYTPTYIGNIGNGCQLSNTADVQVAVTVHELPTAEFTQGDGVALCANDPSASAALIITFTGVAPFTYEVVDDHNNVVAHATTMTNNATIYVAPDHQTTYRINLISDNYCENPAVGDAITATVYVNEIQFADNFFVSGCTDNNQVTISFNMISGNPTAAFTVTYENGLTDNGNISNNTATFAVPTAPGDYNAVFTVDGCDYDIVVRVLVGDYGFGGSLPIMDQRWNDVVVVNNNPANNGGHTFIGFQWYHNGEAIPGATYSNYQDKNGLNGFYSVELTEMDENGNMVTYRTCEMYFNSASTVKVYPVPANVRQEITIELELTSEELEGAILDIYSVTGAHISHVTDLQPITKIEGFKAQGTYFGRILTGTNEIKTVKFIIVK